MALPKIQAATQTFTLPLMNRKITYRRFLVKEEKILLMAAESGEQADLMQAFKQVLTNCIVDEDIHVSDIPMFDLELLFLLLRINSVSDIADIRITDPVDENEYDLSINLTDVVKEIAAKTVAPERQIQLTEDIGVVMKYATIAQAEDQNLFETTLKAADAYSLLGSMIEKVYDKDNVYIVKDFTKDEILDFVESFTPDAMKKIEGYINSIPTLKYEIPYKRKDGSDATFKLEGLGDFFPYL